mmetsp:Transcript_24815/g.45352  ORF Transcript_24815/g.45352 Transcript_24815/m.45352 type:complete len:209 (+) Transcript_24815:616-1242(+)
MHAKLLKVLSAKRHDFLSDLGLGDARKVVARQRLPSGLVHSHKLCCCPEVVAPPTYFRWALRDMGVRVNTAVGKAPPTETTVALATFQCKTPFKIQERCVTGRARAFEGQDFLYDVRAVLVDHALLLPHARQSLLLHLKQLALLLRDGRPQRDLEELLLVLEESVEQRGRVFQNRCLGNGLRPRAPQHFPVRGFPPHWAVHVAVGCPA